METLQLLAVALGLAALSGINLYLTVFVTGLAVRFEWIALLPQYEALAVLGHPAIIAVAGTLYFVEFFADKIPWVDSAWDSIHTVIRPVGAALLAIQVLGDVHPVMDVIVALLAGTTALSTHLVKAGGRLVINGSPEPASNITASLGEDAVVVGGLALLSWSPVVALVLFILLIATIWCFAPRVFRLVKARAWLIWRKLNLPAKEREINRLPTQMPSGHKLALKKIEPLDHEVAWAVHCLSSKGYQIAPNLFGYLVGLKGQPESIFFIARRAGRHQAYPIEVEGYEVGTDTGFMGQSLILHDPEGNKPKYLFIFDRGAREIVGRVAEEIRRNIRGGWASESQDRETEPVETGVEK